MKELFYSRRQLLDKVQQHMISAGYLKVLGMPEPTRWEERNDLGDPKECNWLPSIEVAAKVFP